ncbi:tail fiber domain-containing protein [Nitrospirillum sp. BR 11163]|uniref:tail fiber domain-containing protein n=1 Tax=Nitrospirillum sp. BR 11163 TaxID=3104323 RepID=UPI002AFE9931|nr:tail fiber domain-containing protein [Nitrospirillum sp. BR 11163]MEA1676249.1 tail fiber domain-containing protein [Nitrospirillum sp. BR 11163]
MVSEGRGRESARWVGDAGRAALIAVMGGVLAMSVSTAALADCPTWHVLQNGQTASANDVMDNFKHILGCGVFTGGTAIVAATGDGTELPLLRLNSLSSNAGNGGSILWTNNNDNNLMAKIAGVDSGGWGGTLIFATKTNASGPSPSSGPTEKMRIDNGGNVGIGNTAPQSPLHINRDTGLSTEAVLVRLNSVNAGGSNGGSILWTNNSDANQMAKIVGVDSGGWGGTLIFGTKNNSGNNNNPPTEKMRIDNAGNVGIGTASPGAKLDVAGNINAAGSVTQNSDMRLKTDVAALPDGALDQVLRLRPVTFRWKAPKDAEMEGRQTGLIAQETEAVLPDAVMTAKDKAGTKSIKYNEVMVTMLKALQEQQGLIQQQQKTIQALQDRVEQLEAKRP